MNLNAELTNREMQVAKLLAWGASKKEVPYLLSPKKGKLPISVHTVENITRNIYEKTETQKISELCVWYHCKYNKVDIGLSPINYKRIARDNVIAIAMFFTLLIPTLDNSINDTLRARSRSSISRVARTRTRGNECCYCIA